MLPTELSTSTVPAYVTLSNTSSNYAYNGTTFGSMYSLLAAVANPQMWKGSNTRVVYIGGDFVVTYVHFLIFAVATLSLSALISY